MITCLVFDHALRIRLKAETDDSKKKDERVIPRKPGDDAHKASDSPEHGSTDGVEDTDTLHSQSHASTSASTEGTVAPPESAQPSSSKLKTDKLNSKAAVNKKKNNIVGKINNLVTSDLANISAGRDVLFLGTNVHITCV